MCDNHLSPKIQYSPRSPSDHSILSFHLIDFSLTFLSSLSLSLSLFLPSLRLKTFLWEPSRSATLKHTEQFLLALIYEFCPKYSDYRCCCALSLFLALHFSYLRIYTLQSPQTSLLVWLSIAVAFPYLYHHTN